MKQRLSLMLQHRQRGHGTGLPAAGLWAAPWLLPLLLGKGPMGWDGMGRDKRGWNRRGWDGIRCRKGQEGMGREGMGWDRIG